MKRKKLLKNEVIELFNTTKETLRYYEKVGLISPEVRDNNYRYYGIKDIRRLRQIFMLKELGVSVDEIKLILSLEYDQGDYIKLFEKHEKKLVRRINREKEMLKNINQVVKLLKNNEKGLSYHITKYPKRYFLSLSLSNMDAFRSLREYYNHFSEIISLSMYTERRMISLYDYSTLENFGTDELFMGVELYGKHVKKLEENNNFRMETFEAGEYLSVFYKFNHNSFKTLKSIKKQIDNYLFRNNLTVKSNTVIEIEHPELSIHMQDDCALYEIQLLIDNEQSL